MVHVLIFWRVLLYAVKLYKVLRIIVKLQGWCTFPDKLLKAKQMYPHEKLQSIFLVMFTTDFPTKQWRTPCGIYENNIMLLKTMSLSHTRYCTPQVRVSVGRSSGDKQCEVQGKQLLFKKKSQFVYFHLFEMQTDQESLVYFLNTWDS